MLKLQAEAISSLTISNSISQGIEIRKNTNALDIFNKSLTPFLRETFGFKVFFVTLCPLFSPTDISVGAIALK